MNFKLKALVAAVAIAVAGGANAATQTGAAAGGSSLLFQAWDGTQSFIYDLGSTFDSFYGSTAAVTAQPSGNLSFNLGSVFTSAFGSNANVQWSVLATKSTNAGPSRNGVLGTTNTLTYGSLANTTIANMDTNENAQWTNAINALAGNTSVLVPSSSGAYTPNNTNAAGNYSAVNTTLSSIAQTGFFSGAVGASTVYGAQAGISYFAALINSSNTPSGQVTKTAFAGDGVTGVGAANWILQSDGTLTYHVAAAAPAAVPLPAAVWLFGSGLLGLVGVARRRRDNKV